MSDQSDNTQSSPTNKAKLHPLSIWIPLVVIALGLMVFWNYMVKLKMEQSQPRLPYLSRLEKNFIFTERSGQEVELKELKGKVILASWVFTKCPRGCPGVVAEMMKVQKELGDVPEVHLLTASVDPDDTPEQLKKFTDNFGITAKNWWFVTAPKDELRLYMTKYFGFQEVQDVPEADRLTPDDKFIHDMKVALVDHEGRVRGLYDISSPDPQFASFFREKLREDIKTLLKDQKEATR